MILKYLLFILMISWCITASDPHYGTILFHVPEVQEPTDGVLEHNWMATDSFKPFILDKDDLVSDRFTVTDFYYPNVHFWFLIYTQFESSQIVIHDKQNLSLIYKVLDFSSFKKKNLNSNAISIIQQKISDEKVEELKEALDHLTINPFSLDSKSKEMYRLLKNSNIDVPVSRHERMAFFNTLKNNIRTQTGQKDYIKAGIVRSLPYKTFLKRYFMAHNLPQELWAIPFLESSFNPKAESRVGASGAWQIMPLIASFYVPKRLPNLDYRSNISISSIVAALMMKENYTILKSWDLAVTAYNSGTKHLLKTKRKLINVRPKIDLETVINFSDSKHFGFASKNFYSEFLALVHALAYEDELFYDIHRDERYNSEEDLSFYLTKCSLNLSKVLAKSHLDDVFFYNDHLKDKTYSYPRGTIISAKEKLPSSKFFKLSDSQTTKYRPKDWNKFLRNQSCSTK